MPKYATDYSRTCMYKLCCKDPSIKDEYYGHTTNKIKRKQNHKFNCINSISNEHNQYVYKFIRENGGWENWSMIVVEEYPCENVNEAKLRERHWIETQRATLNKHIPMKSKQEYIEEHREEIKENQREYYEKHREERLEYHKQYREERKEEIKENQREYYEKHKEEILERNKQYREEHKEEIREQKSQKFDCECGGSYTNSHKIRHMKTQRHLKYLEDLNKL